ncbi:ABC transporter ATP-binding protein [Curtobacterium flaccumfaciens]|nr:ABC transporter ATP-binding protein [Curtobacterium flaccumfaciens]
MAISTPVAPSTSGAATDRPDVIVIDHVRKRFVVRKDNTIRERIVTLGRAGRKHRQDFWALDDVTVSIQAGTTVGLIGQNGSGKSTLLKAIGGIIQPTSGTVARRGRLAALLELGAGFHPDLSGRENVFLNASLLGLSRKETEERFDDILAFSGIGDFIDTQVKFYSSGMYVRLAFAVAVHTDPTCSWSTRSSRSATRRSSASASTASGRSRSRARRSSSSRTRSARCRRCATASCCSTRARSCTTATRCRRSASSATCSRSAAPASSARTWRSAAAPSSARPSTPTASSTATRSCPATT